ncbi:MAG: FGGY family carbohydrate kinase [Microbacteriaceae bacterium]
MVNTYVMGIDVGTEGSRAGIFSLDGKAIAFASSKHELLFPKGDWVEQHPETWWKSASEASREAVAKSGLKPEQIIGLSASGTGTTVVAAKKDGTPLRNAIMWMDVRASEQANRIAETGNEVLKLSGGNASAEWLFSKSQWIAENEPEIFAEADIICECVDWLGHKMTGNWVGSLSLAAVRGYYRYSEGGWPVELIEQLGHSAVLDKLVPKLAGVGESLGELTSAAAAELGLSAGIPVAASLVDAEVAMFGMNVTRPGQTCLITGSSHLLLGVSDKPVHGPGMWGAYEKGVTPENYLVEGGQASTGSITKWLKNFANGSYFGNEIDDDVVYAKLVAEAAKLPIGSDGVRVLDFWQGNRTPYIDPKARGMIWGLSVSSTPHHIFRAMLEGISFGTENILQAFKSNGYVPNELVIAGGATRNPLWLQIHSDVAQIPLVVPEVTDAVVLGNAILAALVAGCFPDIYAAADAMTRNKDRIEPNPDVAEEYAYLFDQYKRSYLAMRDLMHEEKRVRA